MPMTTSDPSSPRRGVEYLGEGAELRIGQPWAAP